MGADCTAQVIYLVTFKLYLLHPPGLSTASWGLIQDPLTLRSRELSHL